MVHGPAKFALPIGPKGKQIILVLEGKARVTGRGEGDRLDDDALASRLNPDGAAVRQICREAVRQDQGSNLFEALMTRHPNRSYSHPLDGPQAA